jgi:hypothetical protein
MDFDQLDLSLAAALVVWSATGTGSVPTCIERIGAGTAFTCDMPFGQFTGEVDWQHIQHIAVVLECGGSIFSHDYGCLLMVLMLGAFLFQWRTALLSIVAIPLSLVAAYALALLVSMFVALTVMPALSLILLSRGQARRSGAAARSLARRAPHSCDSASTRRKVAAACSICALRSTVKYLRAAKRMWASWSPEVDKEQDDPQDLTKQPPPDAPAPEHRRTVGMTHALAGLARLR